jgi:peroxiredoxin
MKEIWKAALAVILISGLYLLTACTSADAGGIKLDSPAPGFELRDLNGKTVSLEDQRGKTVVVNFWTTTCPPCVKEMPHFQSFYQEQSDSGDVAIFMVNIGEDRDTVKSYIEESNYTFPVLLDSSAEAAQKYGIRYTPTTVFIDANGQVKASIVGAFPNKSALEKQVNAVR